MTALFFVPDFMRRGCPSGYWIDGLTGDKHDRHCDSRHLWLRRTKTGPLVRLRKAGLDPRRELDAVVASRPFVVGGLRRLLEELLDAAGDSDPEDPSIQASGAPEPVEDAAWKVHDRSGPSDDRSIAGDELPFARHDVERLVEARMRV